MSYLHNSKWVAEIGLLGPNGFVVATLLRKEFDTRHQADLAIYMNSAIFSCYGQITSRVYNKNDISNNFIFWPR